MNLSFPRSFELLTGFAPFPWQTALYERFVSDRPDNIPAYCDLPTGLGKTSVIPIWLLALKAAPSRIPRRLAYVVNRRTVVDQASAEARKLRDKLVGQEFTGMSLAISTIRGQLVDEGEWWRDPTRPAVVVGTIDLVGSALLFSSYRVGMKHRPLHAGLLGQDTLLVHDEAHLSKPFQGLLTAIEREQKREEAIFTKPFRVLALTATPDRQVGDPEPFELTAEDHTDERVRKRLHSNKGLGFHGVGEEKGAVAEKVAELALAYKDSGKAILVYVRTLDDVDRVATKLRRANVNHKVLTGTIRGNERDELVETTLFKRFLTGEKHHEGTDYLLANSAGEVGIDISADHMVCDLTPFESMAQRFGRVNRRGETSSHIDVVHESKPTESEELYDVARRKTLELFRSRLLRRPDDRYDVCPDALRRLPGTERQMAFGPQPDPLPTTDFLLDLWALTSITSSDELPGRPPVEDWLHGKVEDDHETHFAWRREVDLLRYTDMGEDRLRERTAQVTELLSEYPLRQYELLRMPTYRVKDHIKKLAKNHPQATAWVIGLKLEPRVTRLLDLVESEYPEFIGRTIILSPTVGGLTEDGRLDGTEKVASERAYDVADRELDRCRFVVDFEDGAEKWTWNKQEVSEDALAGMTRVAEITLEENEDGTSRALYAYVKTKQLVSDESLSRRSSREVTLVSHNTQVGEVATKWAELLKLPPELQRAISIAARCHDLGKDRVRWQRSISNSDKSRPLAKSGHSRPLKGLQGYRHEFGSLIDVHTDADFSTESDDVKALVLHFIAAHHGRGRPHFSMNEAFDPETPIGIWPALAEDVAVRSAHLQQKYGRWGLAYLESLIRSADAFASVNPVHLPLSDPVKRVLVTKPIPTRAFLTESIRVKVDLTNPGQFFACCGLFELANRLKPGAEAWFDQDKFLIACDSTLIQVLNSLVGCTLTNTMSPEQHARFEELESWTVAKRKSNRAEDEYKELDKLRREAPIVLEEPFNITLDWFADAYAGGSRFKTWAGRQSVLDISTAMKVALNPTTWRDEACLSFSASECGLPFNFDSDLGGQGGAIDIGFSFDPLAGSELTRIKTSARPALELLAFIGLQRFRPTEIKSENRFLYTAWSRPLPIQVAMPAACGAMPVAGARRYEFKLLYRTKYLKSFLPAIPFIGASDE